jgi:hypothetical protein
MKELVIICYMFHKSVYLLRFCNELSSYEPECLRFINNYNSTTSLYDRVHNKILVTFRNENMVSLNQNVEVHVFYQFHCNSFTTNKVRVAVKHCLPSPKCKEIPKWWRPNHSIFICVIIVMLSSIH